MTGESYQASRSLDAEQSHVPPLASLSDSWYFHPLKTENSFNSITFARQCQIFQPKLPIFSNTMS